MTIGLFPWFLDFLVFFLNMKHEIRITQAISWSTLRTVWGSLRWTRRQGTWVLVPAMRLLGNKLFPLTFTFVTDTNEKDR